MKTVLSMFLLSAVRNYVYMLQQVEYRPLLFLRWLNRLVASNASLRSVSHRQTLVRTMNARLLLSAGYITYMLTLGVVVLSAFTDIVGVEYAILLFILLPIITLVVLTIVVAFAYVLIVKPQQQRAVTRADQIFASTNAVKIAVVGSYGKTTMKELLTTVLSEGKNVASTPGNMNTAYSQARFAARLTGDEEVLVVEFGEAAPDDVRNMTTTLQPDYVIITGVAPNHLEEYKTLDVVASDIFSVYDYVAPENIFVNVESGFIDDYRSKIAVGYDAKGCDGFKTSKVNVTVTNTSFTIKKGEQTLQVTSGLLGTHQVGPLSAVAAVAYRLGLKKSAIEQGLAKTMPFEHRMKPRQVSGAWIVDDTYNGNIMGLLAGLDLLKAVEAKYRWYVTPGLVEQGEETERVHKRLGEKIAETSPDKVVLMQNSVASIIAESAKAAGYKGDLQIIDDPLAFYQGLEHIIAAGDVVLLQNDWTDNYN